MSNKDHARVRCYIDTYKTEESFNKGFEKTESTALSFTLDKDFSGNIFTEIYSRAKEMQKFKSAEDLI